MKNFLRDRLIHLTIFLVFFLYGYLNPALAQSLRSYELPTGIQAAMAKASHDTLKINILLDSATQIQQSDPTQAMTYCFAALQLASEASSDQHFDRALLKIGRYFLLSGAYNEALTYFLEYQKRALKSGNRLNQLKIRHNIVALKLTVNDKYDEILFGEMKALLKDYEAFWVQSGDSAIVREMIPGLLINLSHVAVLKGTLNEADQYLKAVFELSKQHQILKRTILELNLSDFILKTKMGKFEEAFELAAKLREMCIQADNLAILSTLEYYLGNAKAEKGDTKEAAQSYENAYKLAEQLGNHSIMSVSASKLYEIYQKNGNLVDALKYNNASTRAKDAMKKAEAAARVAQSEMLERVHALENEMKREKRSLTFRFFFVMLISVTLFLGILILFFKTRKKYQYEKIEKTSYAMEVNKSVIEKETLASALESKDKQLAAEVMYRVQKNEIIKEVVQKLHNVQRQQNRDAQKEMTEAIKGLERAIDNDSWEDFELRFLQVHQGFYDRLQAVQPKLTTNERRLCAFLKLGMSSKEISTLTGQSTDSIIKARHRLRKKLGLPDQETSLVEFFADF
jgi:tetratricopeptide (TPR) repeat protein